MCIAEWITCVQLCLVIYQIYLWYSLLEKSIDAEPYENVCWAMLGLGGSNCKILDYRNLACTLRAEARTPLNLVMAEFKEK